MNRWILLLAALAAWASAAQAKKIVCYMGGWAVYRPGDGKFEVSDNDFTLCTHYIYTFIGITEDGNLRVLDGWQDLPDNYGKNAFGRIVDLRNKQSPNTKILIAIGGWNEGSARYSTVAGNPALRAKFTQNAVNFLKKYNFDGLDLDWEYPAQRGGKPEDKRNFSLWIKELRTEFDKHGFLLTAAVASAEPSASQSYEIAELGKHLHFINVMAYDLHGSWEKTTGHNAPLHARAGETGNDLKLNVEASVNYWLSNGCPPEKFILGVPFYGRSFTLADKNKNGLGAPTTGPGTAGQFTRENGMLGFNEICLNLKQGGWTVVRDKDHKTPYAFKDNQWVGYDDVTSLTLKTEFIKAKGLGGAMLWSVETDDFRGRCGEKYPLLKTLNAGLRGGIPVDPPVDPAPTEKPDERPQPPVTQPPVTQPPPPVTGICKKDGFVRDEKDCNVYYQCVNAGGYFQVHKFNCAAGLVFDLKINGCNYKNQVPECN